MKCGVEKGGGGGGGLETVTDHGARNIAHVRNSVSKIIATNYIVTASNNNRSQCSINSKQQPLTIING